MLVESESKRMLKGDILQGSECAVIAGGSFVDRMHTYEIHT